MWPLSVQEIGIAILTAIWTEVQITYRAIWKCDLSCPRLRFGLRDFKSLVICDLWFGALSAERFGRLARKRNSNPNFLVSMSSRGVGVFHVKGRGPKSSVCPSNSKPRETKLFGGMSRNFWWAGEGVPEKFEKKIRVQLFFSSPIIGRFSEEILFFRRTFLGSSRGPCYQRDLFSACYWSVDCLFCVC